MSKPTNATPKPLSYQRDPEAIVKDLFATNGLTGVSGELITEAAYCIRRLLKAQPAPVPLAEDEALIAEALDDDAVSWPLRKEGLVRQVVERLSLRSGQLAKARSFIVRILVECGPGAHPGRTPEEAADEIIEGNK